MKVCVLVMLFAGIAGRLQIAGCKDEGTCNKIVRHVINCLNNIYHHVPNGQTVFERHVCEPSGQVEILKRHLNIHSTY